MTNKLNIALDVDGILSDFIGVFMGIAREKGYTCFPESCSWRDWKSWDYDKPKVFAKIWNEISEVKGWEEIFLNLPPMPDAEVPFIPKAYVTSRPVSGFITEEWLRKNEFPPATVITVGPHNEKLEVCRELKVDYLVDDRADTAIFFRDNNERCLLFNRPWNINVETLGIKRISSLKEIE